MPQFLQFALAVTLFLGGGCWLYAQLFILSETEPLPVAAAVTSFIAGAGWLYGDFIFPRARRSAPPRQESGKAPQ